MANTLSPDTADKTMMPQLNDLQEGYSEAVQLVDNIILKKYITNLPEMSVIPLTWDHNRNLEQNIRKIRLFKITEMVYERDESATYKFASVFNAVASTRSAIITVIDSDGTKTNFYLGIRALSDNSSTQTSYSTLHNAIKGQFPGIKTQNLISTEIIELLNGMNTDSISSVSCIANTKNANLTGNREYLQGLEKLALAMQGKQYTAVIIANSSSQDQLNLIRQGYENVYTQLSPYTNSVINLGANRSGTITQGMTTGANHSKTYSYSHTSNNAHTDSMNTGEIESECEPTKRARIGRAFGGVVSAATEQTVTHSRGGGSTTTSVGIADTINTAISYGGFNSKTNTFGISVSESQGMQLTIQNKALLNILERIDKQLERLSEFESVGMWECAAYFLSGDPSVSKVAAATYKALISGEESGIEISAINTWNQLQHVSPDNVTENDQIAEYIRNFIHPVFAYQAKNGIIPVTAASLVSSNELAIHIGLPRHSVCGFPVIEHCSFGQEVVRYRQDLSENTVNLGYVFNMGQKYESSRVSLDIDSLAMHTFITGATGSGKSNTIYTLLNNLTSTRQDTLTFMSIEPAKGEYKRVFGYKSNVSVFGTNPEYTPLLKINPFKFPKEIHVLEHIDRLIDIFNVCWPMYAAMPAVLKDAMLFAYSACGWDLTSSRNAITDNLFPTFQDLLEQLVRVINESSYSDEVKSNYVGSLSTRVRSLTNGLNGQIFSAKEVDNRLLFDTNVVIDLSRIGSQETKSLIMGILIMRLSEYRMSCSDQSNSKLRHITVLEEAHNILGSQRWNTGSENCEDISGKSVEMLSNAIAEMRTYGEGFIIADQSPGAVDVSAIRNTNTKIILRLPEENDRRVAGKSAALRDDQIDEIAKLPQGVAVVYQNDWVEPILCQIDRLNREERPYKKHSVEQDAEYDAKTAAFTLVNFIVQDRLSNPLQSSCEELLSSIEICDCTSRTKAALYSLVREYQTGKTLHIWNRKQFKTQSHLVSNITGLSNAVEQTRRNSSDFYEFTVQLNTLIAQKFNRVSDDLLLTISHCLIKEYSESCEEGSSFYERWVTAIRKGGQIS